MPAGGGHGDRGLVYGAMGHPQNTAALLDTIAKLKQDLVHSNAEKQTLVEQMNVLITLIKRSWSGDYNASLHLGNIVGVPPPEFPHSTESKLTNTPVPEIKERVIKNWERMAMRLLELNYNQIQQEIHKRQQAHIQNRQLYMDEVLYSHHTDMAKYTPQPRYRPKTYQEVDQRFIKTYNQRRPNSGNKSTAYRLQSAKTTKKPLENSELTVNDLLIQSNGQKTVEGNSVFTGLHQMENDQKQKHLYRPVVQYDDPQRYKQTNLFDLDYVFGPDVGTKKTRPASAFVTSRDKPGTKTRPKSAGVFVTQPAERPLKYETTRPVSAKKSTTNTKKPPSRKSSLKSASEPALSPMPERQEEYELASPKGESEQEDPTSNQVYLEDSDSDEDSPPEDHIGKDLRIRVASATNQPKHVQKFVTDLKTMENMEKDFKKCAAQLQKRLGIEEMGMIK